MLLRFFIRVRGAMTATRVPLKENRGGRDLMSKTCSNGWIGRTFPELRHRSKLGDFTVEIVV